MADTYTIRLLFTQPEVGQNLNIWGTKLNAMFALVDKAIAGRTGFALSGTKTLTRANGAADEARSRFQDITGGTGGTVTIPSVESWYLVRNNSAGNVIFTTGGDVVATISPGTVTFVVCDGASVWAPNLDGYVEQVEALIAQGIADMNAILAETQEQVGLAADQVALAAGQVTLAAAQVTIAQGWANTAQTFSIAADSSADDAEASAIAAAKSAKDAALFDPSSYYTKAQTYSQTEVNTKVSTVDARVTSVIGGASSSYDTLGEIEGKLKGLATVANTGSYTDLTNKPSAPVWADIATQATTSGTAITFASIPTTYSDLRLEFLGVSATGTTTIQIELSDDGSNWTPVMNLVTGVVAASSIYGSVQLEGYRRATGSVNGAGISLTADRTAGQVGTAEQVIAWRLAAGISHIRISVGGGAFDAGSIKLAGV